MQITIERTKKGLPAMWEYGGGKTNTGSAQIVTNADGSAKKPVYIRRSGSLANGDHALFIINHGDVVVQAFHHRRDFLVRVMRIADVGDEKATCEVLHEFDMGEWDSEPPAHFMPAIEAAKEKATCYHCRKPHYIAETE